MSHESVLEVATDASVRVLRLDRPGVRNALSRELRDQLVAQLDIAALDDRIGAVLITAAGEVFCAGFDLVELAQASDPAQVFADAGHYHHTLHTFPKPLIAAVDGPAVAGGFDLALMCDIRVASEQARFGQPQVRHGIPASYELMAQVLGVPAARELCLTGRIIDAAEARELRLVSEITSPGDLAERAIAVARDVADRPGSVAAKARFVASQAPVFTTAPPR